MIKLLGETKSKLTEGNLADEVKKVFGATAAPAYIVNLGTGYTGIVYEHGGTVFMITTDEQGKAFKSIEELSKYIQSTWK